ncbi:hypothetical protein LI177_11170 [bacterium 210820-DFI.6.37]|nr:hypothetical protein [bacterium 210820-DFI.6.37]
MKYRRKIGRALLAIALFGALFALCACSQSESVSDARAKESIETTLNLANNEDQEWTYEKTADAWILSPVSAVANPELPDQQGVSVCVPGAYITGIDTDKDGQADVTAKTYQEAVKGALVMDYDAKITSTNGQVYTAASAPAILNTGAAGYGSSENAAASTVYASEGYINIACGNRGKQDTAEDDDGNTYYTGDAPSCLVDQKAAARYVKYNMLLGNLPGNVDYFVSTGGSGGGAHAAMFAATSNNSDFYDYQIEAGAVGVYNTTDGGYSTTVTIDGTDYELSDGAWGCVAYSAITFLYEADMAQAFEYYMDTSYDFNTSFQEQLAEYLSAAYMEYINDQKLSVKEADAGFDLNGDGDKKDTVSLTIQYDPDSHPETNGYYGTYLDLYLAEFTENLQWYLDHLDYAESWTWFDEDGKALSDKKVASMTSEDKAEAFLEGRYAKGSSGGKAENPTSGMGGADDFDGLKGGAKDGKAIKGALPDKGKKDGTLPDKGALPDMGNKDAAGTPDSGTTQSATGKSDSENYSSYEEMVAAYKADVEAIYEGDQYGKNIVSLYNPLNYIGAEETEDPVWTRIVMGASEGDMSMFSSLNLQIAWLNAGVNAVIEWQWDGGHVPSEIFGNSFSFYVDQMYGSYVDGAETITAAKAEPQTKNGTASEPEGTDLSGWVNGDDLTSVSFSLADAAAYRTSGASKAIPGFDVIDYSQEDYVFGDTREDARHWNKFLLDIFEEYADELEPLFNRET